MGKYGSMVMMAFGTLVLLVSAQTSWTTYRTLRDGPITTTVAAAPVEAWVRLEDAVVRCDSRKPAGRSVYYEATSRDGVEPFLVQVRDDVACETLVLEGGFGPVPLTQDQIRDRLGIEPPPAPRRVFSAISAAFLRQALYFSLPMLGLGLLMSIVGARRWRRATARPAP